MKNFSIADRRALWLVCLIAVMHALFFIWYQQPDWATQWTDQDGYRRLGQVLAETGKFTRYPESPTFVPEVLRTPGYPLFVAVIYRIFGVSQLPVVLMQAVAFVATCMLVFGIASRLTSPGVALAAAAATALYSPLPYFGALVMTELWTTFLFTAAMLAMLEAVQDRRMSSFALAGFLFSATALSRPVFFLFPVALVLVGIVLRMGSDSITKLSPPPVGRWAVLLVVASLTLLPWFTYNYMVLGRFTMAPAGGVGRGTWEGSWQAVWPGRLQTELTGVAEDAPDRAALDARVNALAEREHLNPALMLAYVHQWADIRKIWDSPTDPVERAMARVRADGEYLKAGVANVKQQTAAHIAKRLARGAFVLWAAEIPFRYSTINQLPLIVLRLCWGIQVLLICAALYGVYALYRNGRLVEACILGAPILYVTAVHLPLLTEARQSLPAKPVVILLATIGIANLLPFKSQVHEREHL
jgi:4-amino-4-deoxy-L-arabinose transferase-like glycosyltransferase